MFNRKTQFALTPTHVLAALAVSVLAVFAVLAEAVAGFESFL